METYEFLMPRPVAHYLLVHPLKPAPAAVAQWYQPPAQARNQTDEVARGFESSRGAFSETFKNHWKIVKIK